MYKLHAKNQLSSPRLLMVEQILSSAYVDDISCHEFRNSLVKYFINAYDLKDRIKLITTTFPQFKKI